MNNLENEIAFTGLVMRGEDKAINERYRPCTFHEVIGNKATKQSLARWMESGDKRSKVLLIAGNSGCSKTTLGRILAMGLNCEHGDTVNPCCECPSCRSALAGDAMHISEYNMSALSKKEDADEIVTSMYNASFTGRNNVHILDECLHYDTLIDCVIDGKVKKIPIGRIVHKRMNVNVLSYNYKTQLVEVKPVINWFKNPKKEVYEWVFAIPNLNSNCRKILTCTDNHTVFRYNTNEEVQIGWLKEGDLIRGNAVMCNEYHDEAKQMTFGSLLDDGYIGINENYIDAAYCFVEKRLNPLKNRRSHVYDIEVADNHNYFASSINVHNCQSMSTSSQNLMLKMLENPPSHTYVFLLTTNPEKILKTVKTRCEQYEVKLPTLDDIKYLLGSVVKNEMPSMPIEQRKEILEACRGLGYREILLKLDKFIKGGGTGSIGDAFQADYAALAKSIVSGDGIQALKLIEQYDNSSDGLDVEAARRLIRTFLCNQAIYALKSGNNESSIKYIEAFRIFDRGFYTDPNPLPTFKADVVQSCLIIK